MVKRTQKGIIFLGTSSHMMTDVYASFIVGMIPILTLKLGLSLFLVSTLTAVNFVAANLSQPLFGYLSDKYGMKKFLVLGPLVASVFISLLGLAPAYWVILICLFLGNLGVAAIHPPSAAIASYFGGVRKGFANSVISFGGALGFSLGSIFIIFIIEKLGIAFTPLASIPGIVTAAIVLKFAPEINMTVQHRDSISFFSRLKSVKRSKIMLLLLVILVAYFRELMNMTLITFMPLYLTDRGVKLLNFGYIFMAFVLIGGLGGLVAGYYSDRIKKRHIVIQVLLFLSIPCVYALLMVNINASIILFIVYGLLAISTLPLCNRLAQDIFPRNAGLATSFSIGVATGSSAATMLLIGKIADIIGMVNTIRYVTILPLIGVVLLFLFPFILSRVDS
jgi:FSR family fosmidomycin resistance protein-like MFS transporter